MDPAPRFKKVAFEAPQLPKLSERKAAMVDNEYSELLALRQENINLKKKQNEQLDQTKKLTTKLKKVTEDLKKSKELEMQLMGGNEVKPRPNVFYPVRKDLELQNTIEDLKAQIMEYSKVNGQLQNKIIYYKSITDNKSKKRDPYPQIGSKVNAGLPMVKHLVPAMGMLTYKQPHKAMRKSGMIHNDTISPPETEEESSMKTQSIDKETSHFEFEENQKLQALVNLLRHRLTICEKKLEKSNTEITDLKQRNENNMIEDDIERLKLQKESEEKDKAIREWKNRNLSNEEKLKILNEKYADALAMMEELNETMKQEKERSFELEEELKKCSIFQEKEKEYNEIIADLRKEKILLEEQQAKVLCDTFTLQRDEDYHNEIKSLQYKINLLEADYQNKMAEKEKLLEKIEKLQSELSNEIEDKKNLQALYYKVAQENESLTEKIKYYNQEDPLNNQEIRDAIALIKSRKEVGTSVEFLGKVEDTISDEKKQLEELTVQHADCIQELEKTRKLLGIQEHLTKTAKSEGEEYKKKLKKIKNEYELKLEEDARLLDLRANKISRLEAQIKNIVYRVTKIPVDDKQDALGISEVEDGIILEGGQNLVELYVDCAAFTEEFLKSLSQMGIAEEPSTVSTFLSIQFYDFETHITTICVGMKPQYEQLFQFRVQVDDFFLSFVKQASLEITCHRTVGVEFLTVATCRVLLKDLIDPCKSGWLEYIGRFNSINDKEVCVGTLQYTLRTRLPMDQAIHTYKKREAALELLEQEYSERNAESQGEP